MSLRYLFFASADSLSSQFSLFNISVFPVQQDQLSWKQLFKVRFFTGWFIWSTFSRIFVDFFSFFVSSILELSRPICYNLWFTSFCWF